MKNWTLILKGGKIISAEHSCNLGKPTNYICRHVKVINEYATRHSEIQALARIRKTFSKNRKINNIKIINFRITKSGEIKNSKPCLACAKSLKNFGINNIVYSTDDGSFKKDKIDNVIKNATYSKGSIRI